jgi:hypothetical protein
MISLQAIGCGGELASHSYCDFEKKTEAFFYNVKA